jgi:hypothetical protein
LTRSASHTEIRFSVMLRGWCRGRILQGLCAAGARSGRERGPVHQAAATRPSPAIRSQEQTGSPGRSAPPAAARDATDGAVFRVRRSLGLRPRCRSAVLPFGGYGFGLVLGPEPF